MRSLAWFLLLLVPCGSAAAAVPVAGGWQWQRAVLPAVPGAEQCAVLDAEQFQRSAPGLQDIRLLQDGREVPYALEESHDATFEQHPAGATDRSVYTTVLMLPLNGVNAARGAEQGTGSLPAHVPVERMLLAGEQGADEARGGTLHFWLSALPAVHGAEAEVIEADMDASAPWVLTAIGANLQNDALVSATVQGQPWQPARLLLQMRERLLCFQPLSSAPLTLLFGNAAARPPRYDYAVHHRPAQMPLLARLGPVEHTAHAQNAKASRDAARPWRLSRRLLVSVVAGAVLLALAALVLLR